VEVERGRGSGGRMEEEAGTRVFKGARRKPEDDGTGVSMDNGYSIFLLPYHSLTIPVFACHTLSVTG